MHRRSFGTAAALLALVVQTASAGQQQGRVGSQAITTLAGDVQADWSVQKDMFVNAADAMPDDRFAYKSTPAQRSFGEHVMHVVQANMIVLGMLGAKAPAPSVNLKATAKADVMAALRQSMDYGEAVVREFTDQQLNERVTPPPSMGTSASRLRVIYGSLQHTFDIYGQMVVYLRLNGVVPPASRRGGL